ncbi:MAG: DUF3857 domain-containing protein, partial [Chitinophagaceae bacterium]
MMIMKQGLYFVLVALFFHASLSAGEPFYPVANIPAALLANANAVVRLEETSFEVLTTTQTRLTRQYVVTILNERGDHWAELYEVYDKHRDISAIEGALYDGNGKLLKRVKRKDISDHSGVSNYDLMADDRIRYHNFYHRAYPYTVAYNISVEYKSTLQFPAWVPQRGEGVSVESSNYTIISKGGYNIRHKAFNYSTLPEVTQAKNGNRMSWSLRNKPAIYSEAYAPGWQETASFVLFGPTDFQVDQYKGNMQSWQDFGKFIHALREGRDKLPAHVKQTVHAITDPVSNPRDKVIKLYEYLQRQTRYISIQLGIGGWQPFPAEEVAAKGYGDCKALTNYMASLLQEAGIRSIYTLVRAGNDENFLIEDFPSQQFNHVILCVPLVRDTIWLECTDQSAPAGYLGRFTSDRPALLVDQNGGQLVRTPVYGVRQNERNRHIQGTIDGAGTMSSHIDTRYTALRQEGIHYNIQNLSGDQMKEYLQQQLDFSNYEIKSFNYKQYPSAVPVVEEKLELSIDHYATSTGKRLFILPNIMSRLSLQLPQPSKRTTDLDMGFGYVDSDSAVFKFSQSYDAESLPKDVAIRTKFGNYTATLKFSNNV